MLNLIPKLALLFSLVFCSVLSAEEPRLLDQAKAAKKEVNHSMIGVRDTLLIYTFEDQQAALRLNIDNKDKTFPVSGFLYLFDETTTAEGLAKWLNNQHSDGIFAEAARPIQVVKLPEGIGKVTKHEKTGSKPGSPLQPFQFDVFEVEFSVKELEGKGYKLNAFEDTAKVLMPGAPKLPEIGQPQELDVPE